MSPDEREFIEANDKPPEREWSQLELFLWEWLPVLAALIISAGLTYMFIAPNLR